jgi:hypothetical protein
MGHHRGQSAEKNSEKETMDQSGELRTPDQDIVLLVARLDALEDISFEGTPGAVFGLPADLISFRSKRTEQNLTDAERAESGARLAKAREAAQNPV